MPSEKRKLGDIGEIFAVDYLERKDYQIIERNYWKPIGEIDIVAKKGKKTVFFEVKTGILGYDLRPEDNLTVSKQKKFKRIISEYLSSHNLYDSDYQIDILIVYLYKNRTLARIEHIENVNLR
jgi:putative endonuclease